MAHALGHIQMYSRPAVPTVCRPHVPLEGLYDASWEGVPGGTGCTPAVALLWMGGAEYICGLGPLQEAHDAAAPAWIR